MPAAAAVGAALMTTRTPTRRCRWRDTVGADGILQHGLPTHLLDAQVDSLEYGQTRGGLPVYVETAGAWKEAINAARRVSTPDEFAQTRILWTERVLQRVNMLHAAGSGNGQFVLVMDCADLALGFSEAREVWPFVKAAVVQVALQYAGCCRRVCAPRPLSPTGRPTGNA